MLSWRSRARIDKPRGRGPQRSVARRRRRHARSDRRGGGRGAARTARTTRPNRQSALPRSCGGHHSRAGRALRARNGRRDASGPAAVPRDVRSRAQGCLLGQLLPFNRGWNDGAGNPPDPGGLKTDYLWREAMTRESLTNILPAASSRSPRRQRDGSTNTPRHRPRRAAFAAVSCEMRDVIRRVLPVGRHARPGMRADSMET